MAILILSNLSTSITPSSGITLTASQKLNELGLLSNISSVELNTTLNRMVGLTMILKSIGYKDADANKTTNSLAFKDLTGTYKWGAGWANIGIEESISMGTSSTTFSPAQLLSKKEFLSYQLRVLGYGVLESWDNCAKLSIDAGLISSESALASPERFTKADAANIMYAALNSKMKEKPSITLAEYLVDEGVVDRDKAMKQRLLPLNKPQIDSIRAISNTRLELTLKSPVYISNVSDFSLKNAYGTTVKVLSSTLSEDGKIILLTTEAQSTYVTHTLTVNENALTYTSTYGDFSKPFLSTISVVSSTSLKLTYSEKVDKSAINVANYSINGIYVVKAEYELDSDDEIIETSILLTTTKQTAYTTYKIIASNIMDLSGNYIDINFDELYFSGKATDTTKPRMYSAYPIKSYKIQVNFSENVDEATAEDLANYELTGFTIIEAVRQSQQGVVYLTTLEQMNGALCTLKIKNIKDLEGNEIESTYTSYNFYATPIDTSKPGVLSASSISNTTVKVVFSEPISDETGNIESAYYFGINIGYPTKVIKDTSVTDGSVWILTTLPQENILYTLDVTGVQDLTGNVLNEDLDTASFMGIE
jgi:hypothetical protein